MHIDDPHNPEADRDIIISPRKGKREKPVPETGILLVNPTDASYAISKLLNEGGEARKTPHSTVCVHPQGNYFLAGPAVSAPVAVMATEKLIALGARTIFLFSCCGSISQHLSIGNIVVGATPQSGEGTSQYYISYQPSRPSKECANKLLKIAKQVDDNANFGNIWTTDAPYRESRQLLTRQRQDHQVVGVDMEYSALCAVCNFRNVKFAGIFIVSDELWGERWNPGFNKEKFLVAGRSVMDLMLDIEFHGKD